MRTLGGHDGAASVHSQGAPLLAHNSLNMRERPTSASAPRE
jgi:hypothetical protein